MIQTDVPLKEEAIAEEQQRRAVEAHFKAKIVYGSVNIIDTQLLTEQEFRDKGDLQHWPADQPLPYSKIVGWTLSGAQVLEAPLPYWRPRSHQNFLMAFKKMDVLLKVKPYLLDLSLPMHCFQFVP